MLPVLTSRTVSDKSMQDQNSGDGDDEDEGDGVIDMQVTFQ